MTRRLSLGIGVIAAVAALGSDALLPAANAEPPSPALPAQLSLDQALAIFRAHGLDLLIADAAVADAEGEVKVAGAIPNPNWTASVLRSFYSPVTPSPLFSSNLGFIAGIGDSNAIEDSLSGKRHLRLKVARAALKAARFARQDAQRTLEFQVKQQYLQAVLARDQLEFALAVQKAWNETLQLTLRRYHAGAISERDQAIVETAKLQADQMVTQARAALAEAKLSLAFLLGIRDQLPQFEVVDPLPKFVVPSGLRAATPSSLLAEAFLHRPDLKGQAFERDRALASIALAKRLRVPDIAFNIQYFQQGSGDGFCPAGATRDGNSNCVQGGSVFSPVAPITPPTLQFGLSGTLPVFYFQQGEIRKAEADWRTQDLGYAKTRAQIVADIGGAYASFLAAKELVERMEGRLLERAKVARDLTDLQYQRGTASLLEYLDAQRTYIATVVDYFRDLSAYWTAVFALEQAVGRDLR